MTEIWPDYVAQAFLPPPGLNRQFRTAGPDRVKPGHYIYLRFLLSATRYLGCAIC